MSCFPTLLGLALGDALGWPVEFSKLDAVRARGGPNGISEPPEPALFTDDTQTLAPARKCGVTLAVAQALIQAGERDLDSLMSETAGRTRDLLR
jgi:ADP-ribosylglycohydrolase